MIRKFALALALALSSVSFAPAEVTAVTADVPLLAIGIPGWSPDLKVAYSCSEDAPRYDMITMEVKKVGNPAVITGDVVVIDSMDGGGSYNFGSIELPPGEYIVIFHCSNGSSAATFNVAGP